MKFNVAAFVVAVSLAAPCVAQPTSPQERAEILYEAAGFFSPDMSRKDLADVTEQLRCLAKLPSTVRCDDYPHPVDAQVLAEALRLAEEGARRYAQRNGAIQFFTFMSRVRLDADTNIEKVHR